MNTILQMALKAGEIKGKLMTHLGMTEEDWQKAVKKVEEKKNSPYWCESCKSLNYECVDCDCDSCFGRE